MNWRIWLLPFVLPFVFAAMIRLLYIFVGVEPSDLAREFIVWVSVALAFFTTGACAGAAAGIGGHPKRPVLPEPSGWDV